jgi:hypothetical protein
VLCCRCMRFGRSLGDGDNDDLANTCIVTQAGRNYILLASFSGTELKMPRLSTTAAVIWNLGRTDNTVNHSTDICLRPRDYIDIIDVIDVISKELYFRTIRERPGSRVPAAGSWQRRPGRSRGVRCPRNPRSSTATIQRPARITHWLQKVRQEKNSWLCILRFAEKAFLYAYSTV